MTLKWPSYMENTDVKIPPSKEAEKTLTSLLHCTFFCDLCLEPQTL